MPHPIHNTDPAKVWTADEFMDMPEDVFDDLDENPIVRCRDGQARPFNDVEIVYGADWSVVGFDPRPCDRCKGSGHIEIPVPDDDPTIEPCQCDAGRAWIDDQAHDGRI